MLICYRSVKKLLLNAKLQHLNLKFSHIMTHDVKNSKKVFNYRILHKNKDAKSLKVSFHLSSMLHEIKKKYLSMAKIA